MHQPCLVTISHLSKVFSKNFPPALQSIQTALHAGKIVGLVGPDGAGKTTLIRILAGLLKPSEGAVSILGYDTIRDAKEIHAMIGYMPQRFGLYEDLTVLQNLNLYAELQTLSPQEKKDQFELLLKFTSLEPFTKRLAKNLSGGMKQKLGLACTLLRKPKLLLLDEPTVGVDPISRRELWKMITDLSQEGISILWSTSYLDEAEKCQEVLLLNEGKLLYAGAPNDLTSKMEGRTFQVQNISTSHRAVLSNALKNEEVLDGVIQGSFVRLVFRKNFQKISLSSLDAGSNAILKEVSPRFEDAFMDILGGSPKGESPISKLISQKPKDEKPIVNVSGLTKKFGSFTAADHISLSVKRGEIFGLLGPNGAGKSTTFKMLCGLLKPTEGKAFISDISIKEFSSKARSLIGYMSQKFALYNNMSVLQNLQFFSGIYSLRNGKRQEIIEQMLTAFDLLPLSQTPAGELPLGFKQRLSLSCAIMHDPAIIFLDEPTSGVDPLTRREFWKHLHGMVEKNVSIIITTHFMDEAEYCDRIGLINQGKLITIGTPDDLKNSVKSKDLPNPTLEDAFILLSTPKENAHAP